MGIPGRRRSRRLVSGIIGRDIIENAVDHGVVEFSDGGLLRRLDDASVAAAKPEIECPSLLGDFPTDSALFYNNRPTSAPTGIAERFPPELSCCRS